MTCEHCMKTISNAVHKLVGINNVDIDLDNKKVTVEFDQDKETIDNIQGTMIEAGFEIQK